MEEPHGNYSSCCRLCLVDNLSSLKAIFDDGCSTSNLGSKIKMTLGITVTADDKVSTMICEKCVGTVESWENFKETCFENQNKLETWAKDLDETLDKEIKIEKMNVSQENDEDVTMNTEDESEIDNTAATFDETQDVTENGLDTTAGTINNTLDQTEDCLTNKDGFESTIDTSAAIDDSEIKNDADLINEAQDADLINEAQDGDVKNEAKDQEESKAPTADADEDSQHSKELQLIAPSRNSRKCMYCCKIFSTPGNRRKHERLQHMYDKFVRQDSKKSVADDNESLTKTDIQKLQFADALKLKAANGTKSPSLNFTKVENCYFDKIKKMVMMFNTFVCICHGVQHKTAKRLFAHLRSLCNWFPIYTCYNCTITFSSRSKIMKHNSKCQKRQMENLIKLSAIKENTEMKLRLYHGYRCSTCTYTFLFHDDYCAHVDAVHLQEQELPIKCECGTKFEVVDDFKKHLYYGCSLKHFCDICFELFDTLDLFKAHVEEKHDTEDGFDFLPVCEKISMNKINQTYETTLNSLNAQLNAAASALLEGENEILECAPDLEIDNYTEFEDSFAPPKPPHPKGWGVKAACNVCGKVYSNYHNMLRHQKTHSDQEKTIPCQQCNEMFRLKKDLKQHIMMAHADAVYYNCAQCSISFGNFDDWVKHKRSHASGTICDGCGEEFFTQSEYARHDCINLNTTTTMHSCTVCGFSLSTQEELDEHMLTHVKMEKFDQYDEPQPKRKKYSCDTCNKQYSGYGGLWEHNKRHHPERRGSKSYPRQCRQCDLVLMNSGAYHMHLQWHAKRASMSATEDSDEDMPSNENDNTCHNCFKVFPSRAHLKAHMKTHGNIGRYNNTKKTYWCNICHQACQGFMELQSHKQEHEIEKINEMKGIDFIDTSSPGMHDDNDSIGKTEEEMEEDYDDGMRPELDILAITDDIIYPCDICEMEFTSKRDLHTHKAEHNVSYVYCKFCKIPFVNIEKLNEHMEMEHNQPVIESKPGVNIYPCNLCKKVFDSLSALSSHQGWHKRVKATEKSKIMMRQVIKDFPTTSQKYICKTCQRSFINDTALQIHILEVHRNIDTSIITPRCEMCAIDFDTQAALDKHNQYHKLVEKQKEYASKQQTCKYCNITFNNVDMLNNHMEKMHKGIQMGAPYKCTYCRRSFDRAQALASHVKTHSRENKYNTPPPAPKPAATTQRFLYNCSICYMGFNVPKDLRNHIIASHPF